MKDSFRQQGTKIKFDYAVLSSEDLLKQINPTDAELEAFFKQNAAKYANCRSGGAQDSVHRFH